MSAPERLQHPAAWWLWGLGLATAASRTTNPVVLLLIIGVCVLVVSERRDPSAPNPLMAFVAIGAMVVMFRLVMTVILGNGVRGETVLFTLPRIPLPDWASFLRIGGRVSLESLLYALYDALRLVAILACIGAANALASPRRLLRYLPATLYDVGTAIVVGLTFAPQLVSDARSVRGARAQTDVIRTFVYVPQDQAVGVEPGVEAVIHIPELPGRSFPGKVTRIADALQPDTRTLLTEIDVPNPDGTLQPGSYCTAELHIPRKAPLLVVPADAIVFDADGLHVAMLEDGVARFHKVTVARDLGTQVEISDGVKAGDVVIRSPAVNLAEGSRVQTAPIKAAAE